MTHYQPRIAASTKIKTLTSAALRAAGSSSKPKFDRIAYQAALEILG